MNRHSIWRAPVMLAVVSLVGLVVGLLGDGPWDWACWIGLGLPVAVCGWFGLRRTVPPPDASPHKATQPDRAPSLPTIGG